MFKSILPQVYLRSLECLSQFFFSSLESLSQFLLFRQKSLSQKLAPHSLFILTVRKFYYSEFSLDFRWWHSYNILENNKTVLPTLSRLHQDHSTSSRIYEQKRYNFLQKLYTKPENFNGKRWKLYKKILLYFNIFVTPYNFKYNS